MADIELSQQELGALTVEETLHLAIKHHQAGQLQEAETSFSALIQAQPKHPDAHHNLGLLAVQFNQTAAGLPHFKTALETSPNQVQYWLSYIEALLTLDKIDLARRAFLQGRQRGIQGASFEALASKCGVSPTALESAIAHREAGRYLEAVQVLENWLGLNAQDASAYALLAHFKDQVKTLLNPKFQLFEKSAGVTA